MAAVATDVALLFLDKLSRELGLPKHGLGLHRLRCSPHLSDPGRRRLHNKQEMAYMVIGEWEGRDFGAHLHFPDTLQPDPMSRAWRWGDYSARTIVDSTWEHMPSSSSHKTMGWFWFMCARGVFSKIKNKKKLRRSGHCIGCVIRDLREVMHRESHRTN